MISATLAFFALAAGVGHAQDRVILRDNRVETGRVTGVRNGNVMVAVAAGEKGLPLNIVASVEMPEPPGLATARAALRAGEAASAIGSLRPVVEQFKGLPAPWAEEATGLLGEAYIAGKDLPKAAAAFAEFRKLYPGGRHCARAEVGIAELDLVNKKTASARTRLDPIADAALKAKSITAQDGAVYGKVFVLLGRIHEAEGRYPEALESYLRTVTLFHHDPAAAEDAQKRADALRKSRSVMVP